MPNSFRPLIILPTYNERENIGDIIPALLKASSEYEILIVDDNSPDGTAEIIRRFQAHEPRLHLCQRNQKQGLGPAYLEGFHWAFKKSFSHIVQMDADFSHRIEDLKRLLEAAKVHPVVIGSRWIHGGKVANWSFVRTLLSKAGNLYTRAALSAEIKDWTGGFNVWRCDVLRQIHHDRMESMGYVFQIELKYRALKLNFKLFEVPIRFEERRSGQSKMSLAIIAEAWWRVWLLRQKLSSFSRAS